MGSIEEALAKLTKTSVPEPTKENEADIFEDLITEGILDTSPEGTSSKERLKAAVTAIQAKTREQAYADLPPEAVILKTALERNIPVADYKAYVTEAEQLKKFDLKQVPDTSLAGVYEYLTGESPKVAAATIAALIEEGTHEARLQELIDAKLAKLEKNMEDMSAKYTEVENEIHAKNRKVTQPIEEALANTSKIFEVTLDNDIKEQMRGLITPVTKRVKGKNITVSPIQELLSDSKNIVTLAYLAAIGGFEGKLNLTAAANALKQEPAKTKGDDSGESPLSQINNFLKNNK